MDEYIYDLASMAKYLRDQSEDNRNTWMINFLINGFTAPLIGVSFEQSRSSIIEILYLLSDDKGKFKLRKTLKEIYKMIPLSDFQKQGLIELCECIALLSITELFPNLYKIALENFFKNTKSSFIPDYLDLHTIILKTLFGLPHERDEIDALTKLAKRDIADSKYTLECFHFLMYSPKHSKSCIKYIPLLLLETKKNERDYEGVILNYLKIMGDEEMILRIRDIVKLLKSKYLLDKFQVMLSNGGITFTEEPNKSYNSLLIKINEMIKKVPQNLTQYFIDLFKAQENFKTIMITREVCSDDIKQNFLRYTQRFEKYEF
jgi:hypothetical protein